MLYYLQSFPLIQAPFLSQYDWLVHGFGLKDITIEDYLKALKLPQVVIPKTHQPHGNKVHLLRSDAKVHGPGPKGDPSGSTVHSPLLEGDAFVTDQASVVCWVRTADCLPILIVDIKKKVVGAVHAGWRGTAAKIILETLKTFQNHFKSSVADLRVALGPAICGRCYQVGMDVAHAFEKAGLFPAPWIEESSRGRWHLDIAYANLHLLEEAGLRREQIYTSLACTACDLEKFRSFRKEGGKKGEQVNFVLIRPETKNED